MLRLAIIVLTLGFAVPAAAQGLAPEIPAATGEPHPEGNDYMRRYHMNMMRHDRDLTMYYGNREVNASLAQCFECHTVQDEAGTPVTYADERHFCRTCHDYAAVRVDCFDCHRSTPADFEEPSIHALTGPEAAPIPVDPAMAERLQAYLDAHAETGPEVQQ